MYSLSHTELTFKIAGNIYQRGQLRVTHEGDEITIYPNGGRSFTANYNNFTGPDGTTFTSKTHLLTYINDNFFFIGSTGTGNGTLPVTEIIGSIKLADSAPTVEGVYRLAEAGTYSNLGGITRTANEMKLVKLTSGVWSVYDTQIVNTAPRTEWIAQLWPAGSEVWKDGVLYKHTGTGNAPTTDIPGSTSGNATVWTSINGVQDNLAVNTTNYTNVATSTKQVKQLRDSAFTDTQIGWNIAGNEYRQSVDWNQAYATNRDGRLVLGTTAALLIPISDAKSYVVTNANNQQVVYYSADMVRLGTEILTQSVAFTPLTGAAFMLIRTSTASPIIIGEAGFIANNGFAKKVPLESVSNLSEYIPTHIKVSKGILNTSSGIDKDVAYRNGVRHINGGIGIIKGAVNNEYYLKGTLNIPNIHVNNEVIPLLKVVGVEGIPLVNVELHNAQTEIGIGIPDWRSTIKMQINDRTGANPSNYSMRLDNLRNHVAGEDVFYARLKMPGVTEYQYLDGSGAYSRAVELANYTLADDALGWTMEIESDRLKFVKYEVLNANKTTGEVTYGTTIIDSIEYTYNASERLDDFIRRVQADAGLLAKGIEIKILKEDYDLLATDLLPCKIRMARLFNPMELVKRAYQGATSWLLGYVVDNVPAFAPSVNKEPLEITLSWGKTSAGLPETSVFINDVKMIMFRSSTDKFTYQATDSIVALGNVNKIEHSLSTKYKPAAIYNLTGHEYRIGTDAHEANTTYTNTSRVKRVMDWLHSRGVKQITIEDALDQMSGRKPFTGGYFNGNDDTSSILKLIDTPDVMKRLHMLGFNAVFGLNSSGLEQDLFPSNVAERNHNIPDTEVHALTPKHLDFINKMGVKVFNHSHYHRSHTYSSSGQIMLMLDKFDEMVRKYNVEYYRMFAYPYNEGNYLASHIIKSYGFDIVCSFQGGIAGQYGPVFKGSSNLNSPRFSIDNAVTWANLITGNTSYINRIGNTYMPPEILSNASYLDWRNGGPTID